MSLEELRDAIDTVEQMDLFYSSVALNRVVAAARLVADGNRILWCAFHEARAVDETECLLSDAIGMGHLRCDIVPKLLLTPPGDTE